MCGLPPFVDEMIDVFIDDDTVFVGVPRLFTKPLRLTAPEGFALVAAGRAAMQLPGRRPRRPARARACRSWRPRSATTRVVVDLAVTPALTSTIEAVDALPSARRAAARRVLDGVARRGDRAHDHAAAGVPRPRRLVRVADDGRSGERRTFRIDRMESIERDRRARPAVEAGRRRRRRSMVRRRRLPRVTLRLQPAARWVVERYPVDDVVERAGGGVDATFAVASERWLERLLLRLGPDAEVRQPAEWRRLGADVAGRLLARYADARSGE